MAEDVAFDIVIVGAGPAGCVLARRLTEDPERSIALLEAGPDYGADPAAWQPPRIDRCRQADIGPAVDRLSTGDDRPRSALNWCERLFPER